MSALRPNVHESRVAARYLRYANTEEERENLTRVDREAFDKVIPYERHLVDVAQDNVARIQRAQAEAVALIADMRERITEAANAGREVDRDFVHEFDVLRRRAEGLAKTLHALERGSARTIAKCEDPYRAYVDLTEKWPQVYRGVPVQ
jgi:dsDNA-binding SOS-regulon protein